MVKYYEIPDLKHVYLEDSFVLGVGVTPGSVEIRLDIVLREDHPEYREPAKDEQYCFRRGALRFTDVKEIVWRMPEGSPAIDAFGETDYGGIDAYEIDGSVHQIVGEIGDLTIMCHESLLYLDKEQP